MKRMESFIKILLMIGIVIYCLTGCMNDYVDSVFNQSDKEEEILEMTDEEKELLLNSEPSEIGKEWIESGKLSPDQKKDIEYIREMKDYLKRKYQLIAFLQRILQRIKFFFKFILYILFIVN